MKRGKRCEREDAQRLVAGLAAAQRRCLRWRELLPFCLALLTMSICAVGAAEARWGGRVRSLVGDGPTTTSARFQVWLAVYMIAAGAASFASARFRFRLAILRFPLVLVLGSLGIAALLVVWVGAHTLFSFGGDSVAGDSVAGASPDTSRGRSASSLPPDLSRPRNLAQALLPHEDAERVLGEPAVLTPSPNWLSRVSSISRYRGSSGSASLFLAVCSRAPRRLLTIPGRRGTPVPELGDAASYEGRRLWARQGEWLLMVSLYDAGPPNTPHGLVEATRIALRRLPPQTEIDAADDALFSRGVRGRLNALLAAVGILRVW